MVVRDAVRVRLYHATDKVGALGIRTNGFAVSHLNDSVDASWFSADPNETVTGSHGEEWLVVVDLPDEVAEQYRDRFPDGDLYGSNFLIPWKVGLPPVSWRAADS